MPHAPNNRRPYQTPTIQSEGHLSQITGDSGTWPSISSESTQAHCSDPLSPFNDSDGQRLG